MTARILTAKPWRAGANEATTFVTTADLTVGGKTVPAGSYTLFAIPNADKPWTLIISKKTGEWGIPYPGEQFDFAARRTCRSRRSRRRSRTSPSPTTRPAAAARCAWTGRLRPRLRNTHPAEKM